MRINSVSQNNQSFTSIIPVNAYIDGYQSVGKNQTKVAREFTKMIKNAILNSDSSNGTEQWLSNEFYANVKPEKLSNPDLTKNLARWLACVDNDFNFAEAKKMKALNKFKISDFIRIIYDKFTSKLYLATGKSVKIFETAGHQMGRERRYAKSYGIVPKDSFEFNVAKTNYKNTMKVALANNNLRLNNGGKPVSMNLYSTSNGQFDDNLKVKLDNIKLT